MSSPATLRVLSGCRGSVSARATMVSFTAWGYRAAPREGGLTECVGCGSAAVSERSERTAQGCRRFRCRDCGKQFNERSAGPLNRTQYPSDVIALVVLWRLRHRLSLRDLPEMFLTRSIVFSYDRAAKQIDDRDWETKLTPALAETCGDAGAAGRGAAGTSTNPTSRCTGSGVVSTAPSIARPLWSM